MPDLCGRRFLPQDRLGTMVAFISVFAVEPERNFRGRGPLRDQSVPAQNRRKSWSLEAARLFARSLRPETNGDHPEATKCSAGYVKHLDLNGLRPGGEGHFAAVSLGWAAVFWRDLR